MKIDNCDNKEKSPDKAERTSSIEDIKKTQSKFYDITNDLAATTANCGSNNNSLLDGTADFDNGASKLKKLLLNSNPEVANLNEVINNGITNNGVKSEDVSKSITTKDEVIENKPALPPSVTPPKSAKQKFWCSECKENFLKLQLFNHMKSVHNKFTCLYCYGFFEKIEKLQQHLVKKHKVQNTSFFDEQTLKGCFSGDKVINAVCCKCATIFDISENDFHTHQCAGSAVSGGNKIVKSAAPNSKRKNSNSVAVQQQKLVENKVFPNNRQNATPAVKEDEFCEQAIEQLLHQQQQPTNLRTSFNGALSELSSQNTNNNVPPPPLISNNETSHNTTSSVNTSTSSMSWHEQSQEQPEIVNNNIINSEVNKLVVPKLTLKIPKAAFNHQQEYDNIDSDEDSGDENSESEQEESEDSGSEDERKSSSLSENDDKENEVRRPENLPILKLKFKNLSSTPELVHDNNLTPPTQEADVDLSECPMDLEPEQQQLALEEPKKIIIDGVVVKPADEDIRPHDINLDESLDKIDILKFLKICLRASYPFCLYCNHARKIVVNGKSLAIHFITHHRFHAMVDSITAEELHPEKIVNKLESSVDQLVDCYFNLESYDDHDEEKREGHVTISHEKLYECFQCRFQTPIHKELYLHNRKMHAKSLINCLMCKTSFYSYSELLCHICPGVPNKQEILDYKFYCCLCNMTNIPSAFRLMVHLRKQHFACDVCLEKCGDQGKLSSHIWKHKLSHICFRCHYYYPNKADIQKHLFWKHGTEGIECKKCVQKKWPHVYHFCIPPAVFQCTHCEMSFSRAMALKVHLRLHEDGAKYPCTEIGCEKKFISKKLLLRHLERHQSETKALENGEQERSAEGTVIIPKEIPEGFCTRTIPVVFKRFTKKPAVRKIEEDVKPLEKTEEVKKDEKEVKKLPDLPETKLNLSESSDSDSSSSDDEEGKKSTTVAPLKTQKSELPTPSGEQQPQQEASKKTSSLTDSDTDDQMEKSEKSSTTESMKNIMENLKSFQESHQQPPTTDLQDDEPTTKIEEDIPDKLPDNAIVHVCQSDHDYAKLWRPLGNTADDLEDMIKAQTIDKDKNKKKDKDAKAAQKAKKKKNDDFSSSDSSSGSSSDSSSGSSSGSSSSGSSSSTSDSSSSEASSLNTKSKPRTKKFTKKRAKKGKKQEAEVPEEPEMPRDPDDIIYESDLLTDETDTDEDFYDEHPLKLNLQINEQRKEFELLEGVIEKSRPSTPSVPQEEIPKLKIKKRKHKKSLSSPSKRQKVDFDCDFSPMVRQKPSHMHTSTPIPKMELHQANQIRQLLQSTQQQPVLPILKEQQQVLLPQYPISTPINVSCVTSASSSRMNSGDEGKKRSQRKRVPNKFYGYTSDDDSMAVHLHLQPNDPFKPIPPPNLTWRKEDLPSRSKSPPKVAPLKLNLTEPQQVLQNDLDLSTKQLPVNVNHLNNAKSDDSSEDDQLFISEPRKRKRKPQSQSMYAFHTLETPPTVSQPPIPRLKLTIGSNNKIRRRNINPLKPPAKKRKVAAGNASRPAFNPRQFDAQLPARILQSPPPVMSEVVEPMSSKKALDRMDKQQKLEVAIQNTQLYFQRYNHAQIGSAEIPQDSVDGDGRVYCYCRRAYDEQQGMIGCDGANCQIEWFHFECVGILVPPRGSWYCPECQKEQQQQQPTF